MAMARKQNYPNQPSFGEPVFVQIQHHFGSSKFKHSREGFNPFFYLFDLIFFAFSSFAVTDFTTSFEALNLCLIVSFRYTVDFPFFIGTTQGESTINCGGVVGPNYFLFFPSYVTTIQSTRDFFTYNYLKSLSGEKLRGDIYNTLLFDFAK